MSETFESVANDFHKHFTSDANARLYCGLTDDLGSLPAPGQAASDLVVRDANSLLQRFEALSLDSLSFDEKLDIELACLKLRFEIHDHSYTFNGKTKRQQMPKAGDEIGDGIFLLFINDPRPAEARLRDIVGRLEAIPDFLTAMLGRLDTPLARWRAMDIETLSGLPMLFETIEAWAREVSYDELDRLVSAKAAAESAMTLYSSDLAKMETTTELHLGTETAQEIVKLRGIDLGFDKLHQNAVEFLRDTQETIETLRERLVTKYELPEGTTAEALQQFLAKHFKSELPNGEVDDILAHYEKEREDILAFIRERDLFPILSDQDMKIIRTPSFMTPSIPAGAMMPPAAFREGTATSMVYLTLSKELVDEHTALSIPGMMIHEGIPGHHLQHATASKHKSIVRRHIEANEHSEGWTTMLEDYMLDIGYKSELADEIRFCGKRDLSRIGARVAIDLFFMTGDKNYLDVGVDCDTSSSDPFVAAGALLQAVTGFVPGRVEAELNWYSQERGYPLSYLTGNRMVWQIKADLAESQAGQLEGLELDRRFHDIYLHSGNMPVRFLRQVFENQQLL